MLLEYGGKRSSEQNQSEINKSPGGLEVSDLSGETPLHKVVSGSHVDMVRDCSLGIGQTGGPSAPTEIQRSTLPHTREILILSSYFWTSDRMLGLFEMVEDGLPVRWQSQLVTQTCCSVCCVCPTLGMGPDHVSRIAGHGSCRVDLAESRTHRGLQVAVKTSLDSSLDLEAEYPEDSRPPSQHSQDALL